MSLIIGFAIVLGRILVGILIPKDTYEIWPRRLEKSVDGDGDEPAAPHKTPHRH